MSKKYYWLKLKNDFFSDKAIKKLRRIAGGDTYTIIYLKMQLLSLSNEGKLYYEGLEDAFYKELALDLDEDVDNVRATLVFLESVGLIEKSSDEEYLLTAVPYLIGSETDKAELMRRKRDKEKALNGNNTVTLLPSVAEQLPPVTFCYTEKEKDIDIEKEKREKSDYKRIVAMYNDTCVSFPRLKTLSESRKQAIKARLKTYTIEDFKKMFEKAEDSAFLKGGNDRNWSATFDWMIKDSNMAKILDGNYDNKGKKPRYDATDKEERLDDLTAIENMYLE